MSNPYGVDVNTFSTFSSSLIHSMFHRCFVLGFLGLSALVSSVEFKKCEDASFCRRFRSWKSSPDRPRLNIAAIANSIESPLWYSISISLQSEAESQPNYGLELSLSRTTGAVRLIVDDISNDRIKNRYRTPPNDVLVEPKRTIGIIYSGLEETHRNGISSFSIPGLYRLEIRHKNLQILFFNEQNQLIQVLNSRNLFAFEKYRRSQNDKCRSDTEVDMACNGNADTQGLWREDFAGFSDVKKFGPSAVGIDVELVNAENVFGLPEHTLPFQLPVGSDAQPVPEIRFFNVDVFKHAANSPAALYGSIPFLHAIHKYGTSIFSSGILWLNPSETFVGLSRPGSSPSSIESTWISETGVIDIFLFAGPTPRDVVHQYHQMTGLPILAPFFALGFHQSKWGYESEGVVIDINEGFDTHNIPMDVMWLDIQHTDQMKYFTWGESYSHPDLLTEAMTRSHRRLVAIVDPHVKVDDSYPLYSNAKQKGFFVKSLDGDIDFQGQCWPGLSSYMDFTRPEVRTFWHEQFAYSRYKGSSPRLFIWNDMNEPSVFSGPELSMPRGAVHGNGIEHRELHNLYGMYFHRSTHEALLMRDPGKPRRPFVLSRAFFAGSHRYGPIWTGDNQASWEFLRTSVPMLLSLSISGLSFTGADVGGFEGHPSKELFIRWHQLGAMAYPFYRCHSTKDSPHREPWTFDSETLDIVRSSIESRYSMLPYWYAAFARYALDGLPIIRPLWFDHLSDSNTFHDTVATEEQIMVGDSILVRGVYEPNQNEVEIYLPNEDEQWYDFNDNQLKPVNGGQRITRSVTMRSIPVFVKAGSIIPMKLTKRLSTDEMADDPFSLRIYLKNEEAVGWLYVDDGDSMKYTSDEDYALIRLTYSNKELKCEHVRGNRDMPEVVFDKIEIFGGINSDQPVEYRVTTHEVVRTIGCAGVCKAARDRTQLIYSTQ